MSFFKKLFKNKKNPKKDPVALVNEIAKLPNDEKKSNEIFNAIQKTQMFYIKKFDELTKK